MRLELPIKYRPDVASFSRGALWKYEIMKKLPRDSILKGGPRESDRSYEPFKRPDSGHHFRPAAEQCAAICHAFQSVLDVPLIGIQMDINISHRMATAGKTRHSRVRPPSLAISSLTDRLQKG